MPASAALKLNRTRGWSWRDRTGERVGRLVVTGWAGYGRYGGRKQPFWLCQCDCGAKTIRCLVQARSCGCWQREVQAAGRLTLTKKTALALERLGLGPVTLETVARMFHVKQSTIARRMYKWPDEPQRWVFQHWKRRQPIRSRRGKPMFRR